MNRKSGWSIGALTGVALSLSSCSYIPGTEANLIETAQEQVSYRLPDPSQARFQNVHILDNEGKKQFVAGRVMPVEVGRYVCGDVLSTSGWRQHFVYMENQQKVMLQSDPLQECRANR